MNTDERASSVGKLTRRQLAVGGAVFIALGVFFLVIGLLRKEPILHWPALTLAVVCGARGLWYVISALRHQPPIDEPSTTSLSNTLREKCE